MPASLPVNETVEWSTAIDGAVIGTVLTADHVVVALERRDEQRKAEAWVMSLSKDTGQVLRQWRSETSAVLLLGSWGDNYAVLEANARSRGVARGVGPDGEEAWSMRPKHSLAVGRPLNRLSSPYVQVSGRLLLRALGVGVVEIDVHDGRVVNIHKQVREIVQGGDNIYGWRSPPGPSGMHAFVDGEWKPRPEWGERRVTSFGQDRTLIHPDLVLDRASGKVVAKLPIDFPVWPRRAIFLHNGTAILSGKSEAICVDVQDGQVLWTARCFDPYWIIGGYLLSGGFWYSVETGEQVGGSSRRVRAGACISDGTHWYVQIGAGEPLLKLRRGPLDA